MLAAQTITRENESEAGTSLVELSIVLTLVFLPLLWGLITFGYAFSIRENMTHAAQEGLRHAVLDGQSASTTNSAIQCDVINDARSRMAAIVGSHNQPPTTDACSTAGTSSGGLIISTNYVAPIAPATDGSFPACTDQSGADIVGTHCVTVTLLYQYQRFPIVPALPGIFDVMPSTMHVSVTQRIL